MEKSRSTLFDLFFALMAGLVFTFIFMVLFVLFAAVSWHELWSQLTSPLVFSAIWISLQTSLAVVALTFLFGFPAAYILALKNFKGKMILDTLVDMPIVLPPLVSGLALLIFFGGDSLTSRVLSTFDVHVIFTKKGIILAQLFVASPFFIKTVKESIAAVSKDLMAASATLGASSFYTFRRILLPLCKDGIYTGLAMTWTRALGEFGATAMVAGCIPRQTETMTISIYMNAMSGNLSPAVSIGLILLGFSFIVLFILKIRSGRGYEYCS